MHGTVLPVGAAGRLGPALRLAAALALLVGCATPLSLVIERDAWFESRVGSFRVVSNLGPEQTREAAERIAVLERLVRAVSNASELRASVPTLVLVLSPGVYAQYADGQSAGVFGQTPRENVLLASDGGERLSLEAVLSHEYGHFALSNDSSFSYPAWYHEGHADMLSSVAIEAEFVRYGGSLDRYVDVLLRYGFLPTQRLFTLRSTAELNSRDLQIFYAQSWLTVLYLTYAGPLAVEAGLPNRSGELQDYLSLLNRGAPAETAFNEVFGVSFDAFDRELRRFFSRGSTAERRIARSAFGARALPAPRRLSAAEAAEVLGSAALAFGRYDGAERLFVRALELDPQRQALAGGLARSRLAQGLYGASELQPLFDRALALAPGDPLAQLDYAQFLLARAEVRGEREDYRRAEQMLESALAAGGTLPEIYLELARAHEGAGAAPARVREALLRGYELAPYDPELSLALANHLAAAGERTEARRIAVRALAGLHDVDQAQAFEALLARWPVQASE